MTVVQMWINEQDPRPDIQECMDSCRDWAEANGHEYRLLRWFDMRKLVGQDERNMLERMWPHPRHHLRAISDLARYRWLVREGGLYADVDVRIVDPKWDPSGPEGLACLWIKDSLYARRHKLEGSFNNSLIWAVPGHWLLERFDRLATENMRKSEQPATKRVVGVTGPVMINNEDVDRDLFGGAMRRLLQGPIFWDLRRGVQKDHPKGTQVHIHQHWWQARR